ncbi:MAG: CDP-alcohol phosphatidyltransferase family protein [Candidatus Freyarchaeota archaeon]|nr:CDP-alcohol phosphatidyltransferase family protein [Candidatus Freyarchaeota archaeon]MDO8091325.1 CDP-alcohol phosphatidyltransferase family protein [Candidatus Sigynarchaeota archaeon]
MLGKFKEVLTKIFVPLVNIAVKLRLTPNRISILGFLFSIIGSILIVGNLVYPVNLLDEGWRLILASVMIFVMGFCDLLDGLVARSTGTITVFGGFLDSVLDRYTEVFIFAAIIIAGYCHPVWGIVTLAGALLVSYARSRAESAGLKNLGIGLAERPERLAILGIVIFIQGVLVLTSVFPPQQQLIYWAIILLAFLTHFTVLQRFYYAFRRLPKTEAEKAKPE